LDQDTHYDLVVLIGVETAIKDGDTTIEQAFKAKNAPKSKEDVEKARITSVVASLTDVKAVEKLKADNPSIDAAIFDARISELKANEQQNTNVSK